MKRGIKRQKRSKLKQMEALEVRCLLAGNTFGDAPGPVTFAPGVEQRSSESQWDKFSSNLASIARQYDAQVTDPAYDGGNVAINAPFATINNDSVLIRAIAMSDADAVINDLAGLGATETQSFGVIVSARIPLSQLNALNGLDSIRSVAAAVTPVRNVGDTTSQADPAMQSDLARIDFGFDGTGITVGVLSDSFDALGGYADDVASGDLPDDVTVLSDVTLAFDPGLSDEGRAMAQLIHDVAPGADIMFYTAWISDVDFANGILALAAAGADVIVDDIGYANEPWFQDGIIAQAIDIVVAQGVSYFAAAGNSGRDSYQGAYQDSGIDDVVDGTLHDFDPGSGVDVRQSVTIPAGGVFSVVLQWDQPYASAGGLGAQSDYDIYLLDDDDEVVASSVDVNVVTGDPFEFLGYVNLSTETSYHIVISKFSGDDAGLLKYVDWIVSPGVTVNEWYTNDGTAVGHVTAAGTAAVGAAAFYDTPVFGTNPPVKESFSSVGGVPTFFDLDGNRLNVPEYRQTPDFVAPDGTNTTFFGQDIPEDSDFFPNFFGTSAAAPHAAAVAALMLQKNPNLTPEQLYGILEDTAIDMATSGPDIETGHGLINAYAAIAATPAVSGGGGGDGGSTVVDACGVALPDGTVSFAGAIGGNFFATNHAILDGTNPGQLGYDDIILDFLRGKGTATEIPKAEYSIAVVGNGAVAWSFSNGTQSATGYERTDYYNINFIDPAVFNELINHDLIIMLSGEDAVTDGLSSSEMALWATVEDNLANAVNDRGLDLWVGASGGDNDYYEFLPTGALSAVTQTGLDPLDGFEVTAEGQLIGVTEAMVDAADAEEYFDVIDNDFFSLEQRFLGEPISIAASGIAFYNDEVIAASDVPGGTTQGMIGLAFQDLDMDGFRDPIESGVAGAKFFIDYNGDGLIGLCEPTATSNALGQFHLRSAYSGTFQIMPVPTAGSVITTTNPVYVTINTDGSASLSAPLEFGVISGSDSGDSGLGGSVPVAPGAYLGNSPIEDDGVFFNNGIKKGTNTVTITSSVTHNNVVMNAWLDLNKDGDFNDANERIFTNVKLIPGQNEYTFTIPTNVFDDSVLPELARLAANMRFRVGPTLNIGATDNDAFGEIEDYKVFITQPADSGLTARDDVFSYEDDTAGQVFHVLANDSSFFNRSLRIVAGSVTNISPVETPPLDITVSDDGTRIIFDASGVVDLTEDITFEYTVIDSAGVTATATVTLVSPVDPVVPPTTSGTLAFNNTNMVTDVNNDGNLSGLDYVTILKELRTVGARNLPNLGSGSSNFTKFIDVNGDGRFSNLDLLAIINMMNSPLAGESLEQEPAASDPVETLSSTPAVEVIAAVKQEETVAPVATTPEVAAATQPRTATVFQPIFASMMSTTTSSEGNVVETEIVSEEDLADATFSSLGTTQSDLLWGSDDELDFAAESGDSEDDIFADADWEEELLTF